jgi:hypothetical protein
MAGRLILTDKDFADQFFDDCGGLFMTPRLRFGDDWVEAYRKGDQVLVDYGDRTYRVVNHDDQA